MSNRITAEKRAEAARIDGAKSSGPTAPEGKARSRQNSFKHGGYCALLLANEEAPIFDSFRHTLLRQPPASASQIPETKNDGSNPSPTQPSPDQQIAPPTTAHFRPASVPAPSSQPANETPAPAVPFLRRHLRPHLLFRSRALPFSPEMPVRGGWWLARTKPRHCIAQARLLGGVRLLFLPFRGVSLRTE